jgi:NADPH2 dehydrogenase
MADPKPTYGHLVSHIAKHYPDFAYIHAVEPRVSGSSENPKYDPSKESNDFLREIWAPRPLICAGGFKRESALERAESTGDLIAFGRLFISNVSVMCVN